MAEYLPHYSVMKIEALDALNADKGGIFADLTFGAGGHTRAILDANPANIVYSTDQDPDAIKNGQLILKEYGERSKLIYTNFENFAADNTELFDGILMDLGVSSHQFDEDQRGFSFRMDGPLDMRMNYESDDPTAADLVNQLSEEDLANTIYLYGEERHSRKIAKSIIEHRKEKKIETTKELENIVFHSYPSKERHGRLHPATKTFQALRIAVNRELEVLESSILKLSDKLKMEGTLCIISFHSLEDRIVKHKFKELEAKGGFEALTKRPMLPTEKEVEENGRSRSAKMRVLKRINAMEGDNEFKRKTKRKY